jgi:hypothetical protein
VWCGCLYCAAGRLSMLTVVDLVAQRDQRS